ncbi:hypothetical protein [Acinetobacter soli]|uniref:hypothetical protein n=1 Tax=Acinetobacter soli TaxID=487316 RepID=UPI0012508853|nr:hypothetical protein [Acinetobacter soli]
MNKLMITIVCAFLLLGCSNSKDKKMDEYIESKHQKIVEYIKENEITVKDVVWSNTKTLSVGVIDDGTNRDGYAQYICEIVSSGGLSGFNIMVKVIDIQKLKQTDKWVTIGKSNCK